MCDECFSLAPQNIPSATVLTVGNKVVKLKVTAGVCCFASSLYVA